MKLGILAHGLVKWGGGVDLLYMVADSLCAAAEGRDLELHLLVPGVGPAAAAFDFARALKRARFGEMFQASGRHSRKIAAGFEERFAELHIHFIDTGQVALGRAARRLGLDCLLPSMSVLGRFVSTPWVGYLYDFQHRHYPQFFSEKERRARDRGFLSMTAHARAIVVNSRAVARDIQCFYPQSAAHIAVMPFCPSPRLEWLEEQPEVRSKYGIEGRYFLVGNQFWLHKNHRCAFEAFALLGMTDLQLVCTGDTGDYRHPWYFDDLKRSLTAQGIADRVRILGHIPKRDQIELLKRAIAVVQPTLFEGGPGGGATYDAVALGVPVILSDIPVNREVDVGNITFFPPGQPDRLAECLRAAVSAAPSAPIEQQAQQLVQAGRSRRVACGRKLIEVASLISS